MEKLEKGRRYHCRVEGAEQTGHFVISEEEMAVELFDYNNYFHVVNGSSLNLKLENGRFASLLDTVSGGGRQTYVGIQTPSTIYSEKIHANTILVGHLPWKPDDVVTSAYFSLKQAKPIFQNTKKVRDIARQTLSLKPIDLHIFEVDTGLLNIKCWYGGSSSLELGLREWWPHFRISFRETHTINTYLRELHRVFEFFSAAAGFQLSPSDISVRRASPQQSISPMIRSIDESFFDVEYLWSTSDIIRSELQPNYSFVCSIDARERRNMASCLEAWLMRADDWDEANKLMQGSLRLHNQMSGKRLLMACRWFEKIPGVKAEQFLADGELVAITKAAVTAATDLGLVETEARISGALRTLRLEANRDRLSRLVKAVMQRFPNCGLNDETVEHLLLAQRLRGVVAHGLLDGEKGGWRELKLAITSMEALCYLLMIKDLPMTRKSRQRAVTSRLVRDYSYTRATG
jgi:hypothetical protein